MAEGQQFDFAWWTRWFVFASHILVLGLVFTSFAAATLLEQRPDLMQEHWRGICWVVFCLTGLWWCISTFPRLPDFDNPKNPSRAEAVSFLIGIASFVLIWQRQGAWSVASLGDVFAANIWLRHRYLELKTPYWALVGACVSSIPVFFLNWPNSQRFLGVAVLGGMWTALDGIVVFAHYARRLKGRFQVAPA